MTYFVVFLGLLCSLGFFAAYMSTKWDD
ncbi:protein MgtS [Biostraticola tofi]